MKKSFFNRIFFTFAVSISCFCSTMFAESAQDSLLGSARVVFQTNYGDIEFGFYPSVAPLTVDHIYKLVRLGCYDTNHFLRVEKGFVAQVADVAVWRIAPLNEEQRKEVEKTVKAEFSDVKHVRGVLSMERDSDPDSAQSSFSIHLGDAPHLDHEYTIFGKVTKGDETLKKLEELPTHREETFVMPTERITILSTYYYDTEMVTCRHASPQGNQYAYSTGEAVTVAVDMVKTMLAKGYSMGEYTLRKAKALDEYHQVSATAAAKVAELSERIRLTDKLYSGVEAVRSMDKNYHISDTIKSIMLATSRSAATIIQKGALWMFDALSRAAKETDRTAATLFQKGALWMADALSQAAKATDRSVAAIFQKGASWMSDVLSRVAKATGELVVAIFKRGALWISDALSQAAKAAANLGNN